MIVFPNAKINLGLNVIQKRSDAYHDLETIFYPVPLNDVLEVLVTDTDKLKSDLQKKIITPFGKHIFFSSSGIAVEGVAENNLCIKACLLYEEKFGLPENIYIHLHKIIPTGAGLGGGSSDASFMLTVLNSLCGMKASESELFSLAVKLGSDCPFFLYNKPAVGRGRGEDLEPCNISLAGYKLLIIKPNVHVSTQKAFENIIPEVPEKNIIEIVKGSINEWNGILKNDFEKSIFKNYPEIESIKNKMLESGAIYASLTGSGSAVYGLFKKDVPGKISFTDSFYFACDL